MAGKKYKYAPSRNYLDGGGVDFDCKTNQSQVPPEVDLNDIHISVLQVC